MQKAFFGNAQLYTKISWLMSIYAHTAIITLFYSGQYFFSEKGITEPSVATIVFILVSIVAYAQISIKLMNILDVQKRLAKKDKVG